MLGLKGCYIIIVIFFVSVVDTFMSFSTFLMFSALFAVIRSYSYKRCATDDINLMDVWKYFLFLPTWRRKCRPNPGSILLLNITQKFLYLVLHEETTLHQPAVCNITRRIRNFVFSPACSAIFTGKVCFENKSKNIERKDEIIHFILFSQMFGFLFSPVPGCNTKLMHGKKHRADVPHTHTHSPPSPPSPPLPLSRTVAQR